MVATLEQNCAQKHEGQGMVWTEKNKICRSKYDTHKIKWTNRVKGKSWYQICGLSPGSRTVQENWQNTNEKTNVFKIECCGSPGQLPTKRMKQKNCRFQSETGSFESLRSCSQWNAHRLNWRKMSLTRAKERTTSACRCRRVSVQRYSVQYKGYNLIGVTTVEGGTARGTTALVYWQLHSSLYTGTVQHW